MDSRCVPTAIPRVDQLADPIGCFLEMSGVSGLLSMTSMLASGHITGHIATALCLAAALWRGLGVRSFTLIVGLASLDR